MGAANRQIPTLHRAPHLRAAALHSSISTMSETTSAATSDDDRNTSKPESARPLEDIPIPTTSKGPATFGYQRALLNRIIGPKLAEGGSCDVRRYKPIFIHDALMFPGSLANLIGKASPEEIINRMTPALLPGAHSHVDQESLQPVLVKTNDSSYVQGMLLFGQGRDARAILNEHYRPFARRRRVMIEAEVKVPIDPEKPSSAEESWKLERRTINAFAWIRSKLDDCEASKGTGNCENWSLAKYLNGTLFPEHCIRESASGRGDEDEDGYLGRDIWVYESESDDEPEREVVHGGSGTLDYERATYFTGW